MVTFIPHGELTIYYQTAGGLAILPQFGGAITGPLKNVRHFYRKANLSDFYTPDAAHTKVLNSSSDPVYYNVLNPSAAGSYAYPNLNTSYFGINTDSVRFAFDQIAWKVKDATVPLILFPYFSAGYSSSMSANILMAFTAASSMAEATGTAAAPVSVNSGAALAYPGSVNIHVGTSNIFGVPLSTAALAGIGPVTPSTGNTGIVTTGGTLTSALTAPVSYTLTVVTDGMTDPNTFSWVSSDGGASVSPVNMAAGTPITLNNGVTVTFAAQTGHTAGATWEFTAYTCYVDLFANQATYLMSGTALPTTSGETLYVGWEADGSLTVWNGAAVVAVAVRANWGVTPAAAALGFESKSTAYIYVRDTTAIGDAAPSLLESFYTGEYLNKLFVDGSSNKHILGQAVTSFSTGTTPSAVITMSTAVNIRNILVADSGATYSGVHYDGFFYANAALAYKMDLVSVLPVSIASIQDTAIISLATTIHPNTDTAEDVPSSSTNSDDVLAIAYVHTAYLANWKTNIAGNPDANKLVVSTNTTFGFAQSAEYPWGLPHPDNPLGFAYRIMNDFLPEESRYYLVVGESKDKAFNTLSKYRNILFIGNVWEEFGQGGLDEDIWLAAREGKYDYRMVFTWVEFADKAYRLGSESGYNTNLVAVTLDDTLITKNGADPDFTTLGVVPGDTVVLAQAGVEIMNTVVTNVFATTIRVMDVLDTALFSGTACQIKIYKQHTSSEVKENYVLAQSSTNPGLVKQFNRYVKWGSHFISNRWFVPAILSQKLSYPEHQPLTNITLNSSNFSEVYGDYDYFNEDDLDALVGAGYFIYTADPNGDLPYCIREVTCGIVTGDIYRGNLNAVTPVRTYAASLFVEISRHLGKYNVVGDAVERIKLAVTAIGLKYTTSPVANLGAKLKKATVLSITEANDGVDIDFEALPQKSLNVIRGRLFVRSDN
jgi:hypothetical protein